MDAPVVINLQYASQKKNLKSRILWMQYRPWGVHLTMTCIIFIFMLVFMKSQTGMKKYPLCVIKPILQ